MKIALLYLNKGGGIANCTLELAKTLSGNHSVTCYLSSENEMLPAFERQSFKTKAFIWKRGRLNLLLAMFSYRDTTGISREILADKPDVVIDTGSWWWRRVVFTELKGKVPLAEIVHDPNPHPGSMRIFYNIHHRMFPSLADIVIAFSGHCYRELVLKYPSKYHISSKHGIIVPSEQIDSAAIASKRNKFLFFGLIEPYKGLDILFEAYQLAKSNNPEIELTIAGKGEIPPDLLARIKSSDITLINDYVPESEIHDLINRHGVMVMPYTYATQSGVAAVALANGIPCIATSVGALPEQIQHGRNGIIVPPKNAEELAKAMTEIAGDFDAAKKMSEESYRIGKEEYSWETIGSDLINDIQSALSKLQSSK